MNLLMAGGGLDTLCMMHWCKENFSKNLIYFVAFGQKSDKKELKAIDAMMNYFEFKDADIVFVPSLFSHVDSGMINNVQKDLTKIDDTEIPARNLVLTSLAISYALNNKESDKINSITIGIDGSPFLDCGEFFTIQLKNMANCFGITLHAPMFFINKYEYIKENKLPHELAWSCYFGGEEPCGKCLGCEKRRGLL